METKKRNLRRVAPSKAKPSTFQLLLGFLRHPLTVLCIGTVITTLAVPWLNARSSVARQIAEARQAKALEVLKGVGSDNVRLNLVRSAFQVFEKEGGLTGTPEIIEQRRAELRKRVYDGYGEFEQTAWWWYWEIAREAELFGWLSPSKAAEFRQLAKQYSTNLSESVALVQIPWNRYLAESKETPAAKKQALMPTLEDSLGKKQAERDALADQMVRLFLN
jgi:hypothetical protein